MRRMVIATAIAEGALAGAAAQDKGALAPAPLPPLANPYDPKLAAKEVFGRAMTPTEAQAHSIGFYSRGLPRRRSRAAGRRRRLAGDAPVAQPRLGPPGDDRLPRALLAQGGA